MSHETAQEVFATTFATELSAASFTDHVLSLAPSLAAASLDVAVAVDELLDTSTASKTVADNAANGATGKTVARNGAIGGKVDGNGAIGRTVADEGKEVLSSRHLHATQQILQVAMCLAPFVWLYVHILSVEPCFGVYLCIRCSR